MVKSFIIFTKLDSIDWRDLWWMLMIDLTFEDKILEYKEFKLSRTERKYMRGYTSHESNVKVRINTQISHIVLEQYRWNGNSRQRYL